MRTSPKSWRSLGLSVIAALAIASMTVAPTSASTHSGKHTAKHTSAARCKSRVKAKGVLKYSDWQFPKTLNQYQTSASVAFRTIVTMVHGFTDFTNTGKLYGQMLSKLPTAKNGGISKDGKTYTLLLKHGLLWSNGKEITMNDAKFGLALGKDKNSGPYCEGTCDVTTRIDVKGKYEGIFHLKYPYAPFLTLGLPPIEPVQWSSPHGSWAKGDVAGAAKLIWGDTGFNFEDDTYPTDGPFQVAEFVNANRIKMKPNKRYDVMSCGARASELIFAFYADKPGMIAAAANHETDTTTNYTPADVPTLQGHSGAFKTFVLPSLNIEHLVFNVDPQYKGKDNPLNKVQVRQAMALALDKVTMIQSALGVNASTAKGLVAYSPLVVTKALVQPFADTQLKGQWDPLAKGGKGAYVNPGSAAAVSDAKKLMAKAGFPTGGFTVDGYTTSGNPVRQAQFSFMQAAWQKLGITFNPNYIQAGILFSSYDEGSPMYRGTFQIGMYTDGLSPDPDYLFTSFDSKYIDREKSVHSDNNSQFMGVHDNKMDKDLETARKTTNPKLRKKLYWDWQVINNKNVYWLPLYYRTDITTSDGVIGNYKPNPITYQQWNSWEWYQKGQS